MRILEAVAAGESDAAKMTALAANNLKASQEQLAESLAAAPLAGRACKVLAMHLEEPALIDRHIVELSQELGQALKSPEQLASWIGVCPGREESAGQSKSNRSPKGNRTMRRLLNQIAWGAVRTKDSYFRHRIAPADLEAAARESRLHRTGNWR